MTRCNSVNVKLSNSHFNKWKSAVENSTDISLKLSLNMIVIVIIIVETSFPYYLSMTDKKVLKFHKTFRNKSSANMNLSKTQLFK